MKTACLPIPQTARKVAVFNRNGWQLCSGTGGNFQPEWVAVLLRNMHKGNEDDLFHFDYPPISNSSSNETMLQMN